MGIMVKNFYGKLGAGDGKSIYDFSRALNYRLETTEERIELLNSLIFDENGQLDKYFQEVFTQKFDLKGENLYEDLENMDIDMNKLSFTGVNVSNVKLILSKEDNLYSETNVAKELEKMGSYIIFSAEKDKKTDYRIYKDEQLFNRMMKEQNFGDGSQEEIDTTIHILLEKSQNFKTEAKQQIYKDDIEKFEILAEYQMLLDLITYKLKRISMLEKIFGKTKSFTDIEQLTYEDESYIHQFNLNKEDLTVELYKEAQKHKSLLQKHSALVKKDMLDIKDCLTGTIYFKQSLADSTEIDYDQLDWNNPAHVDALLKIPPKGDDLQQDMVCIQYDLENLLKEIDLSKEDKEILKYYRAGLTLEQIGRKFNFSHMAIKKRITAIIKKIIDKYQENYEDWYYTEIEKGQYKTCKKCGEVKLATERFYDKDKTGKFGLRTTCKICRKK